MIVVKLMGGLGNQLFQYAAGRSLALRHGCELKLDLSFLEGRQPGDTPRSFALEPFGIAAAPASPWESAVMSGTAEGVLKGYLARTLHKARGCRAYREQGFPVNADFFSLPDNVHLDGFWQSERYFATFEREIRQEVTLKAAPSGKNLELAESIRRVNGVALHMRRGDYVSDPKTKAYHFVCDLPYFRQAEEVLTQQVDAPHFFIFSDDPEWVAAHLKLKHPATYISHNAAAPHEDLRLMSLCRHHVIANSSFSWWGAWLAGAAGQRVVAPKRWFNDPSIDTTDVTPPGWCRI